MEYISSSQNPLWKGQASKKFTLPLLASQRPSWLAIDYSVSSFFQVYFDRRDAVFRMFITSLLLFLTDI